MMPELLEDYKAQHVRLVAQTRELERLRQQVRASAEREAAAIVTAARQSIRQVLVDARHELLVLVAQLQAVGCETRAEDLAKNVVQGETTSVSSISSATRDVQVEPFATSQIVTSARRDVREVLLEAQSELVALAEEARELRARIAKQHASSPTFLPERATVPAVPEQLPVPEAEPTQSETEIADAPIDYTPLSPAPRVLIAIAAAVVFAAIGLTLFLSSGRRVSPADPPVARSVDTGQPQASRAQDLQPATAASPSPRPAAARDSSDLSVIVEVRRPAWIRMTIDGRADIGRLFNAGESRTITAKEMVVLRAGDAGAVFVSVNGAQATALGEDGQVVTRRFGNPKAPTPVRPAVLQAATANGSAPASPDVESRSSDIGTTGTADTAAPPSSPEASAEREIIRAAQRWFEAFFVGDAAGMRDVATSDFSMVDERTGGQWSSARGVSVDRGLQQVRIEVAGDGAVMSARLTERATVDGEVREYVSLVSGVWIRTEGRWRLMGVRFIDPASVR